MLTKVTPLWERYIHISTSISVTFRIIFFKPLLLNSLLSYCFYTTLLTPHREHPETFCKQKHLGRRHSLTSGIKTSVSAKLSLIWLDYLSLSLRHAASPAREILKRVFPSLVCTVILSFPKDKVGLENNYSVPISFLEQAPDSLL